MIITMTYLHELYPVALLGEQGHSVQPHEPYPVALLRLLVNLLDGRELHLVVCGNTYLNQDQLFEKNWKLGA